MPRPGSTWVADGIMVSCKAALMCMYTPFLPKQPPAGEVREPQQHGLQYELLFAIPHKKVRELLVQASSIDGISATAFETLGTWCEHLASKRWQRPWWPFKSSRELGAAVDARVVPTVVPRVGCRISSMRNYVAVQAQKTLEVKADTSVASRALLVPTSRSAAPSEVRTSSTPRPTTIGSPFCPQPSTSPSPSTARPKSRRPPSSMRQTRWGRSGSASWIKFWHVRTGRRDRTQGSSGRFS
jgi:hypothetical protein